MQFLIVVAKAPRTSGRSALSREETWFTDEYKRDWSSPCFHRDTCRADEECSAGSARSRNTSRRTADDEDNLSNPTRELRSDVREKRETLTWWNSRQVASLQWKFSSAKASSGELLRQSSAAMSRQQTWFIGRVRNARRCRRERRRSFLLGNVKNVFKDVLQVRYSTSARKRQVSSYLPNAAVKRRFDPLNLTNEKSTNCARLSKRWICSGRTFNTLYSINKSFSREKCV